MKLIAITSPAFPAGEVNRICQLLDEGFWRVHLRKPGISEENFMRFVEAVPPAYRGRIVTHEHFYRCGQLGLAGFHLNRRNGVIPEGFAGSLSCSCHSLEEVKAMKERMDYVFLSPVFNSISKAGYQSAFTDWQLMEAAKERIIDEKVIALGGVSPEKLPLLERYCFGGAAMLGAVWQ